MILGFMNANAQEPEKIEKLKDTVLTHASPELIDKLEQATGIKWSSEVASKIFDFSPQDPKKGLDDFPKLDLGPYKHVAKIVRQNRTKDGGFKFIIDVLDKSYVESKLFDRIKEFNKELKGVEIDFTVKGVPFRSKRIKL